MPPFGISSPTVWRSSSRRLRLRLGGGRNGSRPGFSALHGTPIYGFLNAPCTTRQNQKSARAACAFHISGCVGWFDAVGYEPFCLGLLFHDDVQQAVPAGAACEIEIANSMAAHFDGGENFPLSKVEVFCHEGAKGYVSDVVPAASMGAESVDHIEALADVSLPIGERQDIDAGAAVLWLKSKCQGMHT